MLYYIGKLGGRSFLVALVGLVCVILAATGVFTVSPENQTKLVEGIALIVGLHSAGRGVADGLSGGKTSSTGNGDVG